MLLRLNLIKLFLGQAHHVQLSALKQYTKKRKINHQMKYLHDIRGKILTVSKALSISFESLKNPK